MWTKQSSYIYFEAINWLCNISIDVPYTTAYISWAPEFPLRFLVRSVVLIFLFFLCCPIMCLYVLSSVMWCPLRFLNAKDVQFIFTSSCFHESSCLIHLISVCLRIVGFNTYCVVFFFVLCTLCFSFSWLSFLLPLRYSFIYTFYLSRVHVFRNIMVFIYYQFTPNCFIKVVVMLTTIVVRNTRSGMNQ